MKAPSWTKLAALAAVVVALGLTIWLDHGRRARVQYVSGLGGPGPAPSATSSTGFQGNMRNLLVPGPNSEACQWIAQTQQMIAQGELRVRHASYDNAPAGREVLTPSPYRWWLGLVAALLHVFSGAPLGRAVEQAALWADPLLHLLLIAALAAGVRRWFGTAAMAATALAAAGLFPIGGAFRPGQPDDLGLSLLCALGSILPVLAAVARPDAGARSRRLFALAGVCGGLGLWLGPGREAPVLAGLVVGALAAGFAIRSGVLENGNAAARLPWRLWGLVGAVTTLLAYLAEYFPAHLGEMQFAEIHPLWGAAWLAAGEIAEQCHAPRTGPWTMRRIGLTGVAAAVVVAVGLIGRANQGPGLMAVDSLDQHLSNLAPRLVAPSLAAWMFRDGFTLAAAATFVPVVFALLAVALLVVHGTPAPARRAVAIGLGPLLLLVGVAGLYLRSWNLADAAAIALLAVMAAALEQMPRKGPRLGALALVAAALGPGLVMLAGRLRTPAEEPVAETEVVALIERDLSHWLATRVGNGNAVVLAPPGLTTSLYFHGGLPGIVSPYWENSDGFKAALRICGATSADEAQAVAGTRHLTHIVLPSWDRSLQNYTGLETERGQHSLIALLDKWLPPRWLRPIPYRVPQIAGIESLSVVVYEVVEVQDNPTALSNLAEYFAEMEQFDRAGVAAAALERLHPTDLGATVARAQVAHESGNAAGFAAIVSGLPAYLERGDDQALAWDRRVSLAIVLAEGRNLKAAREQAKQCLDEADEAHLRALSNLTLYRFLALNRVLGLNFSDPRLADLAPRLLPAEMRSGS